MSRSSHDQSLAVLKLPVVLLKSAETIARVLGAGGEAKERRINVSSIFVGVASVRRWADGLRRRRKPRSRPARPEILELLFLAESAGACAMARVMLALSRRP